MSPRLHESGNGSGAGTGQESNDEGRTMTRWGVERAARAANPALSCGEPTGVAALMPPHSQGAERRTGRRARRTGTRWGLRVLVVGGLAGAAWLLTGAAAHAADRQPAPTGPGLLGSVLHGAPEAGASEAGSAGAPIVGHVLQAAVQPLESERPAFRHHRSASILDVPVRVLTRPVDALGQESDATTALGGVGRVVREIAGPLRLTGGPADSPLGPVTAPFTRTLRPVTDMLPHAAMPAAGPVQRPVAAPVVDRPRVVSHGAVPATHPAAPAARVARTAVRPHLAVAPAAPVVAPETVRNSTPGGDGPAPLQGHPGAISGISTTGSGAPTEGGSAAFLPAAVAASSMAYHRLRIATDVEVPRHDAEAPTVSPD
jgi:hypothetical protein